MRNIYYIRIFILSNDPFLQYLDLNAEQIFVYDGRPVSYPFAPWNRKHDYLKICHCLYGGT